MAFRIADIVLRFVPGYFNPANHYIPGGLQQFDATVQDDVEVLFYNRPLGGFTSSKKEGKVINENAPVSARHWALIFRFPKPEHEIAVEAIILNGVLLCGVYKGVPDSFDEAKGRQYHTIGTCRISPKQLFNFAKGISINGMAYDLVFRNCQHWVRALAEKIGGRVWEYIQNLPAPAHANAFGNLR